MDKPIADGRLIVKFQGEAKECSYGMEVFPFDQMGRHGWKIDLQTGCLKVSRLPRGFNMIPMGNIFSITVIPNRPTYQEELQAYFQIGHARGDHQATYFSGCNLCVLGAQG